MSRANKYFFGRFNVIGSYEESGKKEFILRGLKSEKFVKVRTSKWGFFEVDEFRDSELGDFITGYLAKYIPDFQEDVAIPDKQEIEKEKVDNKIDAMARFFLHVKSGITVYHAASGIGSEKFREKFPQVFIEGVGAMFVNADMQSLEQEQKIFDAIKQFSQIRRVKIILHPSNPGNRPLWKNWDEHLHEVRATSYKEEYEADPKQNPEGLSKVGDRREITEKIHMAEDGYGYAEVNGHMDGKDTTVSTGDNPITTTIPPASEEEPPETVFDKLREKIREIFARFKKP
jgi:hypothetical protein